MRKVDGDLFMVGPLIPDALAQVAETLQAADQLLRLPRKEFTERAAEQVITSWPAQVHHARGHDLSHYFLEPVHDLLTGN